LTYQNLKQVLEAPIPADRSLDEHIESYKQELSKQLSDDAALNSKMFEASRKNTTQHFLRLFRFTLKLLKEKECRHPCLKEVHRITLREPATIATVLKLYRNPELKFFIDYLKAEVITSDKLPDLIMALPMKPTDKLVMLKLTPGFLKALHHPEEQYGSWDLSCRRTANNTSHVVEAIHKGATLEEVTSMLEAVCH